MSLVGNYGREDYGFDQRGFDERGPARAVKAASTASRSARASCCRCEIETRARVASAEAERSGEQEVLAARQLAAQAELDAAVVRDREARARGGDVRHEASAISRGRMSMCSSKPTIWDERR